VYKKKKKIILQAFTGGFHNSMNFGNISEKLLLLCEKTNADAVIIGWNTSVDYQKIIEELKEKNIDVYLWLPVFSDYGKDSNTALDYLGNKHTNAVSGAEDDFTFSCPSNHHNIELAVNYYDKYFSKEGFTGVFIDKIRFSSFGNGFTSGMGCFCENCQDFYYKEGVDVQQFKEIMKSKDKHFLIPSEITSMKYIFSNELINELFVARARLITNSVNKVIDSFKQRKLQVGLDVFAPPFAYLFGQDIESLAQHVDFIKPMIYRVTNAPAGIPYETAHLKKELLVNGCDIKDKLEQLWHCDSLSDEMCLVQQLEILKKMPVAIYPGVEVNKVNICDTSLTYVEKTIDVFAKKEIAGCVLSWNVLEEIVYPQ